MAQIPPVRYARGMGGLFLGKQVGLQESWDIYRAERMVANMAGTDEITDQEWRDAMMSHRGPVWEEAVRRAGQERGLTLTGQMAGISGLTVYPTGEQAQRGLQQELRQRILKAEPDYYDVPFEEREDSEAVAKVRREFYDEHPEYAARTMLFKDPRERTIAQIWEAYNAKSKAGKRQARADLGDKFTAYFVDKSKRDYNRFTTEELADIAERLGAEAGVARVAETEAELRRRPLIEPEPSPYGEPPAPAGQVSAAVSRAYDQFTSYRDKNFPGILNLQNQYFAFPQGSAERRSFLAQHPELAEYWDWARGFKADNPEFAAWYARVTGQPAPTLGATAPTMGARRIVLPRQFRTGGGGARARTTAQAQSLPGDWQTYLSSLGDAELAGLIGQFFQQMPSQRMAFAYRYPKLLAWVSGQGTQRLQQLYALYMAWLQQMGMARQVVPKIGKPPATRWYARF